MNRITCHLRPFLYLSLLLSFGCEPRESTEDEPRFEISDAGPALADAGPPARCPEDAELLDFAGKLSVEVLIDGEGPYLFVLDATGDFTVVDDDVWATLEEDPTLQVGGRTVTDARLQSGNLAELRLDEFDGILGGDVLRRFAVTLDVQRGRFWLSEEIREDALLACEHVESEPAHVDFVEGGGVYVPGRLEGQQGWFLVNPGASLGAVPDAVFDRRNEASPRPALTGFYTPTSFGIFWSRLATVGSLEVEGLAVRHLLVRTIPDDSLRAPPTASDDAPLLGMLPSGYLRHFLVTFDYPNRRLRLDAYRDDPLREPTFAYSVGIGLAESTEAPVAVGQVLAGSPADEADVRQGDLVLQVRGTRLDSLDPYSRPWVLLSQAPGEEIDLVLEREGETIELTLATRDLLMGP